MSALPLSRRTSRSSSVFAGALGLVAAVVAPAAPAAALNPGPTPFLGQTSWSSTHGDSRNSDFVPFATSAVEEDWTALDGAATLFAPTIGPEGNLYVATSRGVGFAHLHAFDRDGNLLWESPPMVDADDLDSYAGGNAPIVDVDGDVYCSDGNQLWAFHPNGDLKWVSALPEPDAPFISPVITNDGLVGGVTIAGKVVFFDRATGVQAAPAIDLPGVSDPSLDPAPAGLWDGGFVDPALIDNTYAGFFGGGYEIVNTPAVDPHTGRIFITGASEFGGNIGYLYGIDVVGGAATVAFASRMGGGSGTSPAISPDGRQVYAVSGSGVMTAFDTASGELLWATPGAAEAASPTVGPDGVVYTGAGTQFLTALDPADGSIRWSVNYSELARAELPTVDPQPPLLPSGAPVAGINSVVTISATEVLAVMTFHYVFDNPNPTGRPLLPVYHRMMLAAFSTSDGTLKRVADLRDANEGIVSVDADGSVYVSHGAIFSSLFWNSLNGLLTDPTIHQDFPPVGGITALKPVSHLEQAVQGALYASELAREGLAQSGDAKKGDLDAARTAAERALAQLAASEASMLEAGDEAELDAMQAAGRAAELSEAIDSLESAVVAIDAGNREVAAAAFAAAKDLALDDAIDGLACDDTWACSTGQATFATGVCDAGDPATASATKLTAKLVPGSEKDKVVLKTTLAAAASVGDPLVTGVTLRLGRSAPQGDAHEWFEETLAPSSLVDLKGDGSIVSYKAAKGTTGISALRLTRLAGGELAVKATIKGAANEGARGARTLSFALLLGDDALSDACAGDPALACSTSGKSVKCSRP